MNIKIIVASFIVSIVLALLGHFINLNSIFPALVSFFSIAFISACLTSFWVSKPASATTPSKSTSKSKKQSSKQPHAERKLINGGTKETGSVKWFSVSKGFGFITRDSGEDIFVHFRSILGKGHRILQEGQRVEFTVTEGDKGLQAEEVSPL